MFGFVVLYLFDSVQFKCVKMLSLCLWKSLLLVTYHVTHSSWAFSWVFCRCLPSFDYYFNSVLLNSVSESFLRFRDLAFCILLKPGIWLLLQFNWIYRNHSDAFFGPVVTLFLSSVLGKYFAVDLMLSSECASQLLILISLLTCI